jgi:pyruvate formate lyase activating enzyme
MKTSLWYKGLEEDKVQCVLCPHNCIIASGKRGKCRVRLNDKGTLVTETYGKLSSLRYDPIEKKPLYHYYPGKSVLSAGTVGCNMRCRFCQNSEISQCGTEEIGNFIHAEPWQIVAKARQNSDNIGIAYTYNEPIVGFEFMQETAALARDKGLANIMVTNGFVNHDPLVQLLEVIDAFSVDLKAFTESFYREVTASSLEPVKRSLLEIRKARRHLEIVNLVIPGLNDDDASFDEMINWIAGELGPETILHLSRYFPMYKMDIPATPASTLRKLYDRASEKLQYVYIGNFSGLGSDTFCPECKNLLISRSSYMIEKKGLDSFGKCGRCGKQVIGSSYLSL